MTRETHPLTQGVHHIGLTVDHLDKALQFLISKLGYKKVGEKPDYPAAFVSDGHTMLTLWQAKTEEVKEFDRHSHIGLHHLALKVKDKASFEKLAHDFSQNSDIEMEFSPEPLGPSMMHFICQIPGGIRLELVCNA